MNLRRITPRTCLWPLAISISLSFALSIGLTFRSNHHCYAGTCGEWLFPLQARLHVIIWYLFLSLSITILALRAFQPSLKKHLAHHVLARPLPLINKHLSLSGLLIVLWIACLYGALISIWWMRLSTYFVSRGRSGGVTRGNNRLAAIALTGHLCDVTMGMAILPISRHSALSSFFKIGVGATLSFHVFTAYTLFVLIVIHGMLYVSWLPVFYALPEMLRKVYPVLNPTYLYHETYPGLRSSLGYWRASLVFTGLVASAVFVLIFLTTLPWVRKKHFNVFYFTHLAGVGAVVLICLHASTMLYCVAPGLTMWGLDWVMRLYELWAPMEGRIKALGKGWYRVTTPLPRNRLKGCASTSPLAHFYIHHSESSLRELHPFTTMTHLASQNSITATSEEDIEIQFLFRKRGLAPATEMIKTTVPADESTDEEEKDEGVMEAEAKWGLVPAIFGAWRRMRRRARPKERLQWTARLAGLSEKAKHDEMVRIATQDSNGDLNRLETTQTRTPSSLRGVPVNLRLEGPYFTPANPAAYETVVCLVAGTGVSGALAIIGAFKEIERKRLDVEGSTVDLGPECDDACQQARNEMNGGNKRVWRRLVVVWSVRENDFVALEDLQNTPAMPNLDIRVHFTGKGRPRLSSQTVLEQILSENDNTAIAATATSTRRGSIISGITSTSGLGSCRDFGGSGDSGKKGNSTEMSKEKKARTWVYISGPNPFIAACEAGCKKLQSAGVEFYGARWDV